MQQLVPIPDWDTVFRQSVGTCCQSWRGTAVWPNGMIDPTTGHFASLLSDSQSSAKGQCLRVVIVRITPGMELYSDIMLLTNRRVRYMTRDFSIKNTRDRNDLKLFETAPGMRLALLPDAPAFTIAAISRDLCRLFDTSREQIVGQGFLDTCRAYDAFENKWIGQ